MTLATPAGAMITVEGKEAPSAVALRFCSFGACLHRAVLWNDHREASCGLHQYWLARKRHVAAVAA